MTKNTFSFLANKSVLQAYVLFQDLIGFNTIREWVFFFPFSNIQNFF